MTLSGPDMMDHSNWESWWKPSAQFVDDGIGGFAEEYFSFVISPDCSSCALGNNENSDYAVFNDDETGKRTAYYMTGHALSHSVNLYILHLDGP